MTPSGPSAAGAAPPAAQLPHTLPPRRPALSEPRATFRTSLICRPAQACGSRQLAPVRPARLAPAVATATSSTPHRRHCPWFAGRKTSSPCVEPTRRRCWHTTGSGTWRRRPSVYVGQTPCLFGTSWIQSQTATLRRTRQRGTTLWKTISDQVSQLSTHFNGCGLDFSAPVAGMLASRSLACQDEPAHHLEHPARATGPRVFRRPLDPTQRLFGDNPHHAVSINLKVHNRLRPYRSAHWPGVFKRDGAEGAARKP